MMQASTTTEQRAGAGDAATTATEVQRLDSALLDTLGASGSMITGALAVAGVGLALGGVLGLVAGGVAGLGIGALGALGRTSGKN